jgi:hypothetical protein
VKIIAVIADAGHQDTIQGLAEQYEVSDICYVLLTSMAAYRLNCFQVMITASPPITHLVSSCMGLIACITDSNGLPAAQNIHRLITVRIISDSHKLKTISPQRHRGHRVFNL